MDPYFGQMGPVFKTKNPAGEGTGGAQCVPLESGQGRERPDQNLGVAMRQFNELAG